MTHPVPPGKIGSHRNVEVVAAKNNLYRALLKAKKSTLFDHEHDLLDMLGRDEDVRQYILGAITNGLDGNVDD